MERLQRLFNSAGGASAGPQGDTPVADTAETVHISSLALLKMLKHGAQDCSTACAPLTASAGRAGVPMEVMGLMLGEFVDDYTVKVVDVFAMPQARATALSTRASCRFRPLVPPPSRALAQPPAARAARSQLPRCASAQPRPPAVSERASERCRGPPAQLVLRRAAPA